MGGVGPFGLSITGDAQLPMRKLLLILLAVLLLIGALLNGKVVVIQLEIPLKLLPYHDWLMSFPGLDQPADTEQPDVAHPYPSRSL